MRFIVGDKLMKKQFSDVGAARFKNILLPETERMSFNIFWLPEKLPVYLKPVKIYNYRQVTAPLHEVNNVTG